MGYCQSMRTLIDTGRLIIFILLLPIAIILIGPLLVLAVFRGEQRMGPIVLNTARYDIVGRMGIFMLGLAIWLLVWSGLLWFALLATSPSVFVQIPFISSNAFDPVSEVTSTVILPTVSIATPPLATPTTTETLPDMSEATDTTSPTSTSPPSNTATQVINTPSPTLNPVPTSTTLAIPTPTIVPASTGQPSVPSFGQGLVIDTIKEANLLLQDAITLPSEENLANLELIWQDRALAKVERFATEQYERYRKPFSVQFEFITSPTISEESADLVIVTSRERWSYGWASKTNQESFEFIYTLTRVDNRWIITHYSYRNLPSPTSTGLPAPSTVTATPTIQS